MAIRKLVSTVLLGLAVGFTTAQADDADPWQGRMMGPGMMGPGMMGPGMMGAPQQPGYGPRGNYGYRGRGPMQGYGPGTGMMGPGMMGQGYGPGMGMMGPGMMGQGYGPGMGNGPGGGFTPWGQDLNLSEEQSHAISDILQETQAKHWQTRGQMVDAMNAFRQAYSAEKPDPEAVGEAYEKVLRFQKEMLVDNVQARNRIREVLTDEQREQLRRGPYGNSPW